MAGAQFGYCEVTLTDPRIVCAEGKSRLVFENAVRVEVRKVRVDGCLVTGNKRRCDFLIIEPNERRFHYVELKGAKVLDGLEQIRATIEYVCTLRPGHIDEPKSGHLVCTKVAPAVRATLQRRKAHLEQSCFVRIRYGSNLDPVVIPG